VKSKQRSKKFSARATHCLTAGLIALLFALAVSGSAEAQERGEPPSTPLDSGITPAGPPPAPLLEWGAKPKDIPDGYMVIEGDIIVPVGFYELEMPWATNLWPNGVLDYEFDNNVPGYGRFFMRQAMDEWAAVANVTFREFASCGGAGCVHIQDSNVNSSYVGRQNFRQDLNIFNWNYRFIMAHELAHALGFWHEQSRTDRNTYVTINYGNIIAGQEHNFDIAAGSGLYGPYDFDSVMHYTRDAFSRNGMDTITVLPPNEEWQSRIGQLSHLSRMDQLIMSFIYSFPNWRFVDQSYSGVEIGTFQQPFRNFIPGVNATPNGGTVWVQPGVYSASGTYTRPMTWRAPLGGVTLGN